MSGKHETGNRSAYTLAEKMEAVRRRIYQESSYEEILSTYGIASSTFSGWMKRLKDEVLRRESGKGLPLYVRKYQTMSIQEEELELDKLRRENVELKLINDTCLLMLDLAKEHYHIDVKKNYEDLLLRKVSPLEKGNEDSPR